MDASFWISCNPAVRVEYSFKKYFGKHLYRLVMYAPGGRQIDGNQDIGAAITRRKDLTKNMANNWWSSGRDQYLVAADVAFLNKLRELRNDRNALGIVFRLEEPRVQIYASSLDLLQDIVNTYFAGFEKYVDSIAGPASVEAEAVLNNGSIIRKKDNGYKYKVIIRDGSYDYSTKQSVLNYLINLGDETVHMPSGCQHQLKKPGSYIWNCYYFTNDTSINSFVHIICPTLISNSFELVVMPNK